MQSDLNFLFRCNAVILQPEWKTLRVLISWLMKQPADMDQLCFIKRIKARFKDINMILLFNLIL